MSEQRFSCIPNDAVFDTRLTAMDIRVLASLGTFTNKKGWCFPKQKTIGERIGTSRTNVTASINRLVEFGYVEKRQRIGEAGGKISCEYRVRLDLTDEEKADVSRVDIENNESAEQTSTSVGQTSKSAGQTRDVSRVDNIELEPTELFKAPPSEEPKVRPHSMREDWVPADATRAYAKGLGFADWEIDAAAIECRDYWLDNPKTKRPGWERTFQRSLRQLVDDRSRRAKLKHVRPGAAQAPKPVTAAERQRRLDEYEAYGTWDARWGPKPQQQEARAA